MMRKIIAGRMLYKILNGRLKERSAAENMKAYK